MHDVIVSNVKKLGFKSRGHQNYDLKATRIGITSRTCGNEEVDGAQVVALGGDAAALEAGQDNSAGGSGMIAVPRDRVIKDGDTVYWTEPRYAPFGRPGHTQGLLCG